MIRPLAPTDCATVDSLLSATGNFSDAELTIAQDLMEIVITEPDQTDYHAFVAEVNERVLGFLILGPTPATAGTWDLYWIAVAPGHYGTGVAQSLEDYAVALVRKKNAYWLIAQTSSQLSYERTQAFYRKQGYQSLARIPDYYSLGDDLIIYGKRLDH
jgi:ribosomal protein S18 acetylase RimI-like enzyme